MQEEDKWTSNAQWPEGSIVQRRANDKTTDSHLTEDAARAVCRMLERDGLGGEGKVFPLRTWVEDKSNPENTPPPGLAFPIGSRWRTFDGDEITVTQYYEYLPRCWRLCYSMADGSGGHMGQNHINLLTPIDLPNSALTGDLTDPTTSCPLPTCEEADKAGCIWQGKKVRVRHEWYINGLNDASCRQCGVKAVLKANDQVEFSEKKIIKNKLRRSVKLSSDDWSEVGDLIAQCIEAADIDESYTRRVRDKAIFMMLRIRDKAVDNGLRKKGIIK